MIQTSANAMTSDTETRSIIRYPHQPLKASVSKERFDQLDIRIGTVTSVKNNKKARIPSFIVTINFGPGFEDLKQSSAQLQDNYFEGTSEDPDTLLPKKQLQGMKVAAVTNFPVRSVGIQSYFLTLGVVSIGGETATELDQGTVVIRPLRDCIDGAKVKLLNDHSPSLMVPRLAMAKYEGTFDHLDIRVGTVISKTNQLVDFGELGQFTYQGDYPLIEEGHQILRVFNLDGMERFDNFLGVVDTDRNLIPLTLERPMTNGRCLK